MKTRNIASLNFVLQPRSSLAEPTGRYVETKIPPGD